MAIIKCPSCGKKITDRMEKCPHCNAMLIEKEQKQSITKESIKSSAKESVEGVALALIMTLAVEKVWKFFAMILSGRIIGSTALTAVFFADETFYTKSIVILIVGAVLFCTLSILFKQRSSTQFVGGIALTILFCVIGFVVQNTSIMNMNVPPEIIDYTRQLSLGFGFAFPMIFGSFSILSYERSLKKSLLVQLILGFVFIVYSVLVEIFLLLTLKMGMAGFSLGNLIISIVILGFVILTSKEFQMLITPKKLT